jgi:signal transduction histidine kinase
MLMTQGGVQVRHPSKTGSLSRRTLGVSGVLSLVIGAAFVLLVLAIGGLRSSAAAASRSQQVLIAANTLERQLLDIETGARGFVITGEQRFLGPWQAARSAFPGQAAALERMAAAASPEQGARVRQITRAAEFYINNYSVPLVATAAHNLAAARSVAATEQGERLGDGLRNQFTRLMTAERQILSARQARAISAARRATAAATVGVVGSIALILLSGAFLTRSVIRPVRRAAMMARQVAAGDLTARIPESGPAEVGTLEHALNAMTVSLASGRDELEHVLAEQSALRQVATLVAGGVTPAEVFGAVAAQTGGVLHAECTAIARQEPGGTLVVAGSWSRPGAEAAAPPLGLRWQPSGSGKLGGYDAAVAEMTAWGGARGFASAVTSPIMVEGRWWGVVAAFTGTEPAPDGAATRMLGFTELAAMAIANSDSRAQLTASRARIVAASDRTRRQIERDLHDGAQQRLISLALQLRAAQSAIPPQQRALAEQVARSVRGLAEVAGELREMSRGLHPVILEKGGLGPAVRTLARHSGLRTELSVDVEGRLPERAEVAAYYVVSEALANAAKYARDYRVRIAAGVVGSVLHVTVSDDGPGGADPGRGTGLVGLADRVEALGGRMDILSPAGGGTRLHATIPIAE